MVETTTKQQSKREVIVKNKNDDRIPPIYTYNMDDVSMSNMIRENNLKGVQVRAITQKKHRIQCSDTDTYKKLLSIIRESDLEGGHTFTLPENKLDSLLLKGLSHNFGCDAIKTEIHNATGLEVTVKPFTTDNANKNGWKLNLYTVKAKKEVLIEVAKLTGLFYYRVYWDKIVKTEMIRCARCQASGHTLQNCLNKPGCCKCPGEHYSWECPLPRPGPGEEHTSKAYCRNCKMEGHPTSYKGCPDRKNKMKMWKDNRNEKFISKPTMPVRPAVPVRTAMPARPAMPIAPGTTYAGAVRAVQPTPKKKVSDQGGIEFLMDECDNIFKVGFEELLTRISNFQHHYATLTNLQQKQTSYVKFMASICQV